MAIEKEIKIDPRCPEGDPLLNCAPLIDEAGYDSVCKKGVILEGEGEEGAVLCCQTCLDYDALKSKLD